MGQNCMLHSTSNPVYHAHTSSIPGPRPAPATTPQLQLRDPFQLIDIQSLPTMPTSDPSAASLLPADIFFSQLTWLGIIGTNVTFTALSPGISVINQAVVPLLQGLPILPGAGSGPASPLLAPPQPRLRGHPALPSPPTDTSGGPVEVNGSIVGWRLAVLIVGIALVVAALAAIVFLLMLRRKRATLAEVAVSAAGTHCTGSGGHLAIVRVRGLWCLCCQARRWGTAWVRGPWYVCCHARRWGAGASQRPACRGVSMVPMPCVRLTRPMQLHACTH